jgi:hypothetical protein
MERKTRRGTRVRPAVEGLEGRQLLTSISSPNPNAPTARLLNTANGSGPQDRLIQYTTPQGTHVTITMYGIGSLAGSSVSPNGALNLKISGTNAGSWVVGTTSGGTGLAPLQSVLYARTSPDDLTGIGGTPMAVLNLKNFDLVSGGQINLTAGLHEIFLNSTAANSQVNLRELPESLVTTGSVSTATTNGQTLTYLDQQLKNGSLSSQTLVSVTGQFTPGKNLAKIKTTTFTPAGLPGTIIAPPGMIAVVRHVLGTPRNPSTLPDPQIFGYDPTLNALIRFDATTGAVVQTIPLGGVGSPFAGTTLARDNGQLVVLFGSGTMVQAFNAVTGAPVGQFSTANLAALGLGEIDEMGSTGSQTLVGDAKSSLLLAINVTASLASGHAVAAGLPYTPQNAFELAGGLTGVGGSDVVFAAGAAIFNSFEPATTQLGFLGVNVSPFGLSQASLAALKINGNYVSVGPPGTVSGSPIVGLGSVDQNIALDVGVANGKNTVNLYSQSLAKVGSVTLNDPNLLTGLSESFRPDLAGAAVFDVQGNIQSFRANDAQGLVLNDLGNLNLVQIGRAANSTILGFPFSHVSIPRRSNVTILTPHREVADRADVTVVPGLLPDGPLFLP